MKTNNIEIKARESVAKLKTIEGMEGIANSLERLMDGQSKGGVARSKKLSKKRRKEIATNAANARWAKTKRNRRP